MSYLYVPPADKIVRRVAVGKAPRPAGRDGIDAAADDAHAALLLAPWEVSDKAPHMPVHEYDRAIPDGDAWKGVYGYDDTARTLRVACGAVCYTLQIPPDAMAEDAESGKAVAGVESLTVRVIGDRYLDQGAKVYVAFTEAVDPPSFAAFVAAADGVAESAIVCETASQGVTPNERIGKRATAEIDYGETPASPASYCHICLALADYDDARDAWVEGGAQLDPESIGITFDREVTAADPEPEIPRGWIYALETDGRVPYGANEIAGSGISFQMVDRMFVVYGTTDRALPEDVTSVLHEYHCERRRFRQFALRWRPDTAPYSALNIDGNIVGNMYCALACVQAGTAVVNNPNDEMHARYCLSLVYSTCGILYTTPKTLVEGAILRFPGFRQMEAPPSSLALSEPNTATGGAPFRVALVEVPALPQIVDKSKGADMYGTLDEPPDFVRQIAAGHGDALVGFADITTGPEYIRPPQQSMKVIKTPTSPYLLLLILPIGITTLQHQEISTLPESYLLSAPTYGLRTADSRFRIGYGP